MQALSGSPAAMHVWLACCLPAWVCAEEGVALQSGAMETLGKVAGGDMRKAITTLQSAVRLRVSSFCTSRHQPEHLALVSGCSQWSHLVVTSSKQAVCAAVEDCITGATGCAHSQGINVEPQTLLDVSGAVPGSVTSSVLDACHHKGFSGIQGAITDAIASGWGVSHAQTPIHP